MTRPLAPSEVFHAFLDWQTDFEIDLPATADVPATAALTRLYEQFPALGGRVARTPDGFVLEPSQEPASVTSGGDVCAVRSELSAFAVAAPRPGVLRLSGRLHHALCDVTGILSVADHLAGLLGVDPTAESITDDDAQRWPITAEAAFAAEQSEQGMHAVQRFYAEATPPALPRAGPSTLTLAPAAVIAIDAGCAAAGASLTSVLATAAAAFVTDDRVVVGVPVDCRVFLDDAAIAPRAIGNCSHGALLTVAGRAETTAEILSAAKQYDGDLLDQLESETPAQPFRDGTRYLPEFNPPAEVVVSNARGAARRFARLASADRVLVVPGCSIPGLPMIAVNESPADGAVTITLVAHPTEFPDDRARALIAALARTLTEIGDKS